jgi:predicted component of type VI protein secretion system
MAAAARPYARAVAAELEVWTVSGRRDVTLVGDRLTVGKGEENDVVLDDTTVSRLHAVLEQFPAGWCVTDVGSSNGTFLNGERIWAQQRLRHGDEVRVGRTRLLFRNSSDVGHSRTESEAESPALTVREHDVLAVLCRPLLDRDLFTEPTSIRDIAADLVVSEAAVKQHLANLYTKFDIAEGVGNRRSRLANEALRRGAVTLGDLRRGTEP